MKIFYLLGLLLLAFILSGSCCQPVTHDGYGRYVLKVNCDQVVIDGTSYKITRNGTDFVVGGHSFSRGIYRKTRPWLYAHQMDNNLVDITFDNGSKDIYPLYTGSAGSIFDVYKADGWDISQSICLAFSDKIWLVAHRWTAEGVYFDLQKNIGNETEWQMLKEDLLLPVPNGQLIIPEIATKINLTNFNLPQKTGHIILTAQ